MLAVGVGVQLGAMWSMLPLTRATPLIAGSGSTKNLDEEQKLVDNLRERMQIGKEITVRQTPIKKHFEYAAFGALVLPFKQSFLVPQIDLEKGTGLPKQYNPFIFAHEMAHIENNDILKLAFVSFVTHFALTIIFSFVIPLSGAILLAELVAIAVFMTYSKRIEKRADLRACEVLTNSEIANGILFFDGNRKTQLLNKRALEAKGTILSRLKASFIDENGNNRLDFAHPPLTERISYMKAQIKDPAALIKLEKIMQRPVCGA